MDTKPGQNSRSVVVAAKPRRRTYSIVCISAYDDDLAELDQRVAELKNRFPRASRSWLIRLAIKRLDDSTITDSERP